MLTSRLDGENAYARDYPKAGLRAARCTRTPRERVPRAGGQATSASARASGGTASIPGARRNALSGIEGTTAVEGS